jgi:hypothetical protein
MRLDNGFFTTSAVTAKSIITFTWNRVPVATHAVLAVVLP